MISDDAWLKEWWRLQDRYRDEFEEMIAQAVRGNYSNVRYRDKQNTAATCNLSPDHWSIVLGVSQFATDAEINSAYRKLARSAHPDAGGTDASMAKLNAARDAALKRNGF